MTFVDFVRDVRPGQKAMLTDVTVLRVQDPKSKVVGFVLYKALRFDGPLYCGTCEGERRFVGDPLPPLWNIAGGIRQQSRCQNCNTQVVTITAEFGPSSGPAVPRTDTAALLGLDREPLLNVVAFKVGELPMLGPPLPPKLVKLAGDDLDLLRKGRASEYNGLGVGAFAYYRQFLENRKEELLRLTLTVAEEYGWDAAPIKNALERHQFRQVFEDFQIPEALRLPDGSNPFTFLYGHLSGGVHTGGTDDECLRKASHILEVLTNLMDKLVAFSKDKEKLLESIRFLHGSGTQAPTT